MFNQSMKNFEEAAKQIQPCFNLQWRQADRVITGLYNAHLSDLDLKITQFSVLRAVKLMRSCSQKQLEKVLLVDQATLTRSLQPLLRQDYIQRHASPEDGRIMLVSLTIAGKELYKKAEKRWLAAQTQVADILGEDSLEQLLEASQALIKLKTP